MVYTPQSSARTALVVIKGQGHSVEIFYKKASGWGGFSFL